MIYNYHTHTERCGHAKGKEEDFIKRAIENGIKYMGFSDHFPFIRSDGLESSFRVPVSQVKDYFDTLRALREKYKNEIDIKIGFEMEYYPADFEKMLEQAKKYGAEYLIMGEHFTEEELDGVIPSSAPSDSVEKLKNYVDCVCEGMATGVFTYVAHPDLINFTGDDGIYKEEVRRMCRASKKYNVPLELNFLGIREGRTYPRELFWKTVGEEQSPVTFGFDAHSVRSAFDGASLEKAEETVKKYKLNYIGMPEIRALGD